MSKRKKSYNKINDDNNYYNDRMLDFNNNLNSNQYFNTYSHIPMNNDQDIFKNGFNLNNILHILNNIDFNNLAGIIHLMSDGFDINNINFENIYKNYTNNINYNNEIIINFFNSLKPILGVEFNNIIDKFIQFYMDEINKEK